MFSKIISFVCVVHLMIFYGKEPTDNRFYFFAKRLDRDFESVYIYKIVSLFCLFVCFWYCFLITKILPRK